MASRAARRAGPSPAEISAQFARAVLPALEAYDLALPGQMPISQEVGTRFLAAAHDLEDLLRDYRRLWERAASPRYVRSLTKRERAVALGTALPLVYAQRRLPGPIAVVRQLHEASIDEVRTLTGSGVTVDAAIAEVVGAYVKRARGEPAEAIQGQDAAEDSVAYEPVDGAVLRPGAGDPRQRVPSVRQR